MLDVPTASEAAAMGARAWQELMARRESLIRQEQHDPLRHGWEPPIWKVCDALLGLPWIDADVAEAIRQNLGFTKPVKVLLILGGNRSGKSEYAAKRMMMLMFYRPKGRIWNFHASHPMSVEYQHPLFWKYMLPEYRHTVKSEVEYISYKQKTGFSEDKFVLSNGSEASFKNYEQERDDAIEGGNIDGYWADELVPSDWIETLGLRIAERAGWGFVTFTPVQGYSATVKMFCDGAETMRENIAYALDKDGQGPDIPRTLGFTTTTQMQRALQLGRNSVPQDCTAWLAGQSGQPPPLEGRAFETVPRVMRCMDPMYGVVFFHSSDNPYGNPAQVLEALRKQPEAFRRERFYGVATKQMATRFPKFSKVHVIPSDAIPNQGIRVMFGDPASGRNFFWKWYILTPEGVYLYREWPGNYDIPGIGVPGPWALPDARKADGRPGPAQTPFGWGLLRYKMEIARLEGWKDYQRQGNVQDITAQLQKQDQTPGPFNPRSVRCLGVDKWDERNGAREVIAARFLDSRAASSPRIENDRPRTLVTDFEDIRLFFGLTPGDEIDDGVTEINNALDYDEDLPLDFFNKPSFYVCDQCRNSIFALQTWTGDQGGKGATKDPIDLDRYLFLSGVKDWVNLRGSGRARRGGYY